MKTHTLFTIQTPLDQKVELIRQTFGPVRGKPKTRVSVVTGLHGDELEGLYVMHRLLSFLDELQTTRPESITGEVHLYPAVNPPALNHASRLWPGQGTDLNRTLGNSQPRTLPEQLASCLFTDLKKNADIAVDLHASNLHLREVPQVRVIDEFERRVLPLAQWTNTELIWVHPMADLFRSTLGYNLNEAGIPTVVIEAGICNRVTTQYGDQVFWGLIHLLRNSGALDENCEIPARIKTPQTVLANQVVLVTAQHSGLFVADVQVGDYVGEGRTLGRILDPVNGKVMQEILAPAPGLMFTIREMPLTYHGSLIARIALEQEPRP